MTSTDPRTPSTRSPRQWLGVFLRACLVLACAALALHGSLAQGAPVSPEARQGVLDMSAPTGENALPPVVELQGEWGFAWQRFLDPASTLAPAAIVKAPVAWNDISADGKPAGPDGFGSYTLQVRCPQGTRLALLVPAQRTALRLFVNGQLAARQGEPGATADAARAAIGARATLTEPYPCPLQITAHLSNYSHRAGGMVRALSVGPREVLAAQQKSRQVRDSVLLGAYLVLGLIPIIFFAARRKDPTPLLFGLFCLAQAVYADMTGERSLLQLFGPETGWEVYLKFEYLAWFATMGSFMLLVHKLFASEMRRAIVLALFGGTVAAALVVLATPARVYSHLAGFGQALSVAIGLYVTWTVGQAARRRRPGATVLLGGMAFLLLVVLLDVAQYNIGVTLRSVTPFGLLAFVLAPAIVLARRLARALNAEELRALEQRIKGDLLVRATQAGIYDWDTTSNQVSYSVRLKVMLGHAPDEDTSGWPTFYDFIHPDDREAAHSRFVAQLRDCTVASGEVRHEPQELRLVRKDGRPLWVLTEAISLTGSDCRTLRYICSFIDVSERHAMEEDLQSRNAALAGHARLREDVERMSRHDLKTPLNSIIGVTRLLREDPRLTAEHQELLGITERAGYRMLEMVNLSLDLFRMETGSYDLRPQAVNLADVLDRVMVDMHSFALDSKTSLRFARAIPRPLYVRGEELLCYSIIANLLKNAVEATPPGGSVTVSLDMAQDGGPVRLRIHNPGRVPEAVMDSFFDKYVSIGKSGGSGLGTYSARLMARVQEGDLAMESSDEAGTTLTLTLRPMGAEALPAASPPPLPDASTHRAVPHTTMSLEDGPRRVLVVDDDEYNRLIMRRYLAGPAFAVETAVNGQAAIEAVARQWPDVVLIDLEMPVMNGADAVAWIRRRETQEGRPPCVIVMLSSNDDNASIQRGLQAGSNHYMTKPVTREALLAALLELEGAAGRSKVAHADNARGGQAPQPPSPLDPVLVDADLAGEMDAFLASRRELAQAMAMALAQGERETLRGLAHRAGGGLALYGFQWAAWQCRQIELQAANHGSRELAQAIEALQAHLDAGQYTVSGAAPLR